jgi:DNA-binding CsgD family transcriptional regulator
MSNVPQVELPMLTELNRAGFSAFNATPCEDKMRCLMSYDFHILSIKKKLLVNHKITPLLLNELGQVWLALCTVSLSSHKEAGHIEFRRMGTSQHQVYSLTEHQWIPQEEIRLKTEEKEVLVLSARGYTMKEIAEKVCKSIDTVKFYRKQVFEKLEVENITEALSFAINYGLL